MWDKYCQPGQDRVGERQISSHFSQDCDIKHMNCLLLEFSI
jgi:hypothetical protein